MSTDAAIRSERLVKHFGDVRAVDGLDLSVRRGEIYGFLGRNGSGKTTTIRMVLGLIRPTGGVVEVFGEPISSGVNRVLARLGSLVETATAYPNLTVRENLEIHRRLTGTPREAVHETIDLLGLSAYTDRRAGRLSLGNKQRLSLARALLHRPELLVLDEPANGLDPAGIVEIRSLLRRLADASGVTVFMSSHILSEVAHLADRIGIVHEGRLVDEFDREALHARVQPSIEVELSDPARGVELLREKLGLDGLEITGPRVLRIAASVSEAAPIARILVEGGLDLFRLVPVETDLEETFLRLTQGEAKA